MHRSNCDPLCEDGPDCIAELGCGCTDDLVLHITVALPNYCLRMHLINFQKFKEFRIILCHLHVLDIKYIYAAVYLIVHC